MSKKFQQNEKGLVLLYALLVISFLTAIAITVSIIVVNELKQTIGATDATVAYYAAESGIERGLYTVKRRRSDAKVSIGDAVMEIQGFGETMDESEAHYSTSGTKTGTSQIFHETVLKNDFTQVDYYDAESPLNPDPERQVRSLVIINEGDDPETWAEVSWTAWDTNGQLGTSERARVVIGPTDLSNGWTISALDVFSGTFEPVGYGVRIKPLFGDLSDLTVTPYNQEGANPPIVEDLPSQVEIKSIGTLGTFKQALTARVPWKLPLFGLYDYVLFSEGDIIKEVVLSQPTYSSGTIEVEANIVPTGRCVWLSACNACQGEGWTGLCPSGAPQVTCFGSENTDDIISGHCKIRPDSGLYGFTLPIPDTVPEGEEYYVSLRLHYDCSDGICDERDLAVELSEQSSIVNDQATGEDEVWRTCTIPESFSIGDPSLPEDDPSRTVIITNNPYGDTWTVGDIIRVDWYQLSTYKVFEDCE